MPAAWAARSARWTPLTLRSKAETTPWISAQSWLPMAIYTRLSMPATALARSEYSPMSPCSNSTSVDCGGRRSNIRTVCVWARIGATSVPTVPLPPTIKVFMRSPSRTAPVLFSRTPRGHIENHRRCQHSASHDVLQRNVGAHQVHAARQRDIDQRADKRTHDPADAAGRRYAADERRCDGV